MHNTVMCIDYSQDLTHEHPQHCFAPLEIGYCAALLEREGVLPLSYVDMRIHRYAVEDVIARIRIERPHILCIKPTLDTCAVMMEIAKLAQEYVSCIICYGPAAGTWQDAFLFERSPVDACVEGEIEAVFRDIVRDPRALRSIPGIRWYDDSAKCIVSESGPVVVLDVDDLPMPRHDLFLHEKYDMHYPVRIYRRIKVGYVLSSRGCPHGCTFCSVFRRSSYGKQYRARSASSVVKEMNLLADLGYTTVYFIDDNFSFDRDRVKEICNAIIASGLHKKMQWIAQCPIESLDADVIALMKQAGCSTVCLGVESGSDAVLAQYHKKITQEKRDAVIHALHVRRLMIVAFFIIGGPGETREDVMASMALCKKIQPDLLQLHYYHDYGNAKRTYDVSAGTQTSVYTYDPASNTSRMSDSDIQALYKQFYTSYYLSATTIMRTVMRQGIFMIVNGIGKWQFFMRSMRFLLMK
jgi:anaerobic magnesium-protoporphyrin IX monomethyl ester cyclase